MTAAALLLSKAGHNRSNVLYDSVPTTTTTTVDVPGNSDAPSTLPPVLVRMPNTAFGIAMGLAGNAILWKSIAAATASEASPVSFVQAAMMVAVAAEVLHRVLWGASLAVWVVVGAAYVYKTARRRSEVSKEFLCSTRVHFFNAPHLVLLMLALGIVPNNNNNNNSSSLLIRIVWYVGLLAQVIITQLVYERWMFAPDGNHIRSARPQFLLSTVGWFLLAALADDTSTTRSLGMMCFGAGTVLYSMVVMNIFNGLGRPRQESYKGSPTLFLLLAPASVAVSVLLGLSSTSSSQQQKENADANSNVFFLLAEMVLGWCLVLLLLLFKMGPKIANPPPALGAYWAYVFPLAALASSTVQYHHTASAAESGSAMLAATLVGVATLALLVVLGRTSVHAYRTLVGVAQWEDPLLRSSKQDIERNNAKEDGAADFVATA